MIMHEKFKVAALLLLATLTLGLNAQTTGKTAALADNQPQIAYRIFSDFVTNMAQEDAKDKAVGGIITTSIGVASMATAGGLALWLDAASAFPDNPDKKWYLVGGLGGGGALMTGIGVAILATPIPDYREKYSLVFKESDPVVQEALAAASIRDIAETGKKERIDSALTAIITPVLTVAIMIGIDLSEGKPWYSSSQYSMYGFAGSVIGGGINLFSKSPGEELMEKYLFARDAMYAIPGGHK